MFRAIFICLPLIAFVFVMLGFVFPSCRALQLRSRTQAAWSVLVLLACSKFLFYRLLGGDEFNPDLPMAVIWLWNWMYSGAMILLVLAVALFFLRRKVKAYLLPVLAWSLAAIGIWNGVKVPDVRVVEVDCPALPASLDGYRILQLADIHVSASAPRWRTEAIVAKANAVGADLIVCTGDVVDGNPAQRFADVEPLKTLKARDGVWFCTGNHEFYNDWDAWRAIYGKWGIRFLRNECVFPHEGIALGGVDDEAATRHWDIGSEQFDVEKVFAVATNGEYRVLLQHRPGKRGRMSFTACGSSSPDTLTAASCRFSISLSRGTTTGSSAGSAAFRTMGRPRGRPVASMCRPAAGSGRGSRSAFSMPPRSAFSC